MSLNCFICLTDSLQSKDIQFTIDLNKKKQKIITFDTSFPVNQLIN